MQNELLDSLKILVRTKLLIKSWGINIRIDLRHTRKAIGTTVIVVAMIIIIAIGTIAFVTLSSQGASTSSISSSASMQSSISNSGSTSTSTSSSASYSTEQVTESNTTITASSGLELRVNLNSTVVPSGGAVAAQITLFNSLDQNLSLAPSFPANSTIQSWNGYDFLCGENNFLPMLGYALFQGDYSQGNISLTGSPLQLAPPVNAGCVTYPKPTSIVFLPENDSAVLYSPAWSTGYQEPVATTASTESCTTNGGTSLCGQGKGLSGYWNTTSTISFQQAAIGSPFFRYLQIGEYTLAVQDVWNQTVYAHFQVVPLTHIECPSGQTRSSGFGTVTVGTTSPAIICVEVYDYAFPSVALNLTGALSISALQYTYNGSVGTPRSFSGASNFTVTVSQSQLVLGGAAEANEGTVVAYAITAKPGASGTYELGFLPSSSLNTWMLGPQEPEQCGYYGQLVAGNGQPDYVQPTGCITYTTTGSTSSSSYTVPGIPYPLLDGDLYFRIVDVLNSTTGGN